MSFFVRFVFLSVFCASGLASGEDLSRLDWVGSVLVL